MIKETSLAEAVEARFLNKMLDNDEELAFFKKQFHYAGPVGEGAFGVVIAA